MEQFKGIYEGFKRGFEDGGPAFSWWNAIKGLAAAALVVVLAIDLIPRLWR